MTDVKLDNTGDLELSNGDLVGVSGADGVAQRLLLKLRSFRGEWFLDEAFGVPWYQDVLVRGADTAILHATFTDAISSTPGVRRLERLVLDWDKTNRRLTVSFKVLTTDGTVETSEVLG